MFDAGGRETVSGHECKDSPYDWTDNFGRDCQFYADDPETVRRWGESNVSIDERLCHDVLNNHEGNNVVFVGEVMKVILHRIRLYLYLQCLLPCQI